MSKETSKDADKNIVICYDGTGAKYGKDYTNVVKVFEAIKRNKEQVAFYDPGVGTHSFFKRTRIGKKVEIMRGKAFGVGLQQNIEDGYEYLMNRFKPGDKVFLIGFSRGAFTVRALAGMIHHFGILQKGSINLIPYVSEMYNNYDQKNSKVYQGFKDTFSHDCEPHFIGIWDTVSALGRIHKSRKYYDIELHSEVKNAYHAISIDEKRTKFAVELWNEKSNAEQVWFAGCHSDVGGWYKEREESNEEKRLSDEERDSAGEERGLPDIAFVWMMDKADKCGLDLKDGWKKNFKQDASGKLHESWKDEWRFWFPKLREIPAKAKIHRSVIDRIEQNENYRPKNLIKGYDLKELEKKYEIVTNDSYQNRTKA